MRVFEKTVNVRLLAILLLVGFVSAGGIHWLHGFQARRQAGFFLDQADLAIEEGRAPEALEHLNRYISLRPDDVDALEKLGMLEADFRLFAQACGRLERVLRKDPERTDIRRRLIGLSLASGQFSDARQHISPNYFPNCYDENNELVDAELLVMLARCQMAEREDDRENARDNLRKATELEPDRLDAYQLLALLLRTRLDEREEADRTMEEMVLATQRPVEVLETALLATLLLETESLGAALQAVELLETESLEAALRAYELLAARMLKAESLADRAAYWFSLPQVDAEWLEGKRRLDPVVADETRQEWLQKAQTDAAAALELVPEDMDETSLQDATLRWVPGALLIAAKSSFELGDLEKAREYSEQGIKLMPRRATTHYNLLAEIELQSNQLQKAIAEIETGLESSPEDPELLWNLARVSIHLRDVDKAQEAVSRLSQIEGLSLPIELLNGQISCLKGRWLDGPKEPSTKGRWVENQEDMNPADEWDEARKALESVRPKLISRPSLAKEAKFWLGECYGRLRDPKANLKDREAQLEAQLDAYRDAIKLDQRYRQPRLSLAGALARAGRTDDAIEEYRQLQKIEGHARIELADLLIRKNAAPGASSPNWQEVEKVLAQLPEKERGTLRARMLQVECLSQMGQYEAAYELLETAEKEMPSEVSIRLVHAALLQKQGDWKGAKDVYQRAKLDLGNDIGLQLGWARLLVRRFSKQRAEQLRQQADKESRDQAVEQLRQEAIGQLRQLADDTEELADQQLKRLWRGLMDSSFKVDDREQVEKLYGLVTESYPTDALVQRLMFEVALRNTSDADVRKKYLSTMRDVLEMIKKIQGQEAFWCYGEALRQRLLAYQQGDDKQAREEYIKKALELVTNPATLRSSREDLARIYLLTAEIHDRDFLGHQKEALEYYEKASELGRVSLTAATRMVYLLRQQRRVVEADELMDTIVESQATLTPELSRYQAESLFRDADDAKALELAEKTASDSKDYREHLWLAQFRQAYALGAPEGERREMLDKAEDSYRKAVELSHDLPTAWRGLILFLVQTNQAEKARAALAEFQKNAPPDGAPVEIAVCHVALKQMEEAKAELAKILDPEGEFPEAQVNWARRQLASIVVGQPNVENLKEAEELLRKNLASAPGSRFDKRNLVTLLSVSREPGKRTEAARLLEELIKEKAEARDRFSLAKLYLAQDNWAEASRLLGLAAAEAGPSAKPEYLTAYVTALLDRGQISDAESWLKRLSEVQPGAFPTVKLQAQVLFGQRRIERAIGVIRDFVDSDKATPPHMLELAAFLKAQGEWDEASRLFNLAASEANKAQRPEYIAVSIAAFLDHGQISDADSWLQELNKLAPGAFSTVSLQARILFEQKQAERAIGVIRDFAAGPGATSPQMLVLAAFLGQRGKTEEAVELIEKAQGREHTADFEYLFRLVDACTKVTYGGKLIPPQTERIEKMVKAALDEQTPTTESLLTLANLRIAQERFEDVENLYRQVLKLSADNVIALNNLAVLLALKKKDLDEAVKMIDRAVELGGQNGTLLDSRATVYLANGRASEALDGMRRAIAENERPTRYFHLAQMQDGLRKPKEAAKALAKAQDLGLTAEMLHPLERAEYARLLALLDK